MGRKHGMRFRPMTGHVELGSSWNAEHLMIGHQSGIEKQMRRTPLTRELYVAMVSMRAAMREQGILGRIIIECNAERVYSLKVYTRSMLTGKVTRSPYHVGITSRAGGIQEGWPVRAYNLLLNDGPK